MLCWHIVSQPTYIDPTLICVLKHVVDAKRYLKFTCNFRPLLHPQSLLIVLGYDFQTLDECPSIMYLQIGQMH